VGKDVHKREAFFGHAKQSKERESKLIASQPFRLKDVPG
jgi:hypothetical protein